MKTFIATVILLVATTAAVLTISGEKFTLTEVRGESDAVRCGKNGGRAAFVADLDENGALKSEWVAFCVEAVKE
jgi:hypothetical protein